MQTHNHPQRGISLLEVLASLFVVSIGLLGVLAVIPFGAFQVSKAQHAEYASNMLANAAEEILVRDMTKEARDNSSEFSWFEAHKAPGTYTHITVLQKDAWKELMRGQDDLVYTTYDDKRPDFAGQNDKIQSSGKYTWFFTYLPQENRDRVDVLACYNRVPEDDVQVSISPRDFSRSRRGGSLKFSDARLAELLTQTKYVFVTWEDAGQVAGAWCRIVFVDKSDAAKPQIVVTGDLREADENSMQVYIPSGVLYHKRGVRR